MREAQEAKKLFFALWRDLWLEAPSWRAVEILSITHLSFKSGAGLLPAAGLCLPWMFVASGRSLGAELAGGAWLQASLAYRLLSLYATGGQSVSQMTPLRGMAPLCPTPVVLSKGRDFPLYLISVSVSASSHTSRVLGLLNLFVFMASTAERASSSIFSKST